MELTSCLSGMRICLYVWPSSLASLRAIPSPAGSPSDQCTTWSKSLKMRFHDGSQWVAPGTPNATNWKPSWKRIFKDFDHVVHWSDGDPDRKSVVQGRVEIWVAAGS